MHSQGRDPLWAGILRVWIGAVVNIHRRLYMGNEQTEVDGLCLLYIQLRSNEKEQCSEQYQKLPEQCQTRFDIVPNFIKTSYASASSRVIV